VAAERLGRDADFSKILKECRKEVMTDPELTDACVTAALTNAISAIRRLQEKAEVRKDEATERKLQTDRVMAKARELGAGVSSAIATILDFTMPNGKQLRHCTFAEVATIITGGLNENFCCFPVHIPQSCGLAGSNSSSRH
jgi:hypothetical protein